jgi:hypothetical protein
MNLLNRDFSQMKIAGQHTPFWGGQHGRFLHINFVQRTNLDLPRIGAESRKEIYVFLEGYMNG